MTQTIPLSTFDRLASSFFGPSRPVLARQIPLDATQREDRLILRFDLPGVSEDAIEITVERRTLTVKAARANDAREGDRVFIAERPWGPASRQVVLRDGLDTERISANCSAGVLTITVPVATSAQSRRIEISHAPVETTIETTEVELSPAPADA